MNRYFVGTPVGKPRWQVGIEDPDHRGALLGVLKVDGGAVSTSGGYHNFFEANGVRYGHLLDPRTLRPSDRSLSVTIVSRDATLADVSCGDDAPLCAPGTAGGICGDVVTPATCVDAMKNGAETDVDCGGGACPTCALGKVCGVGSDCLSGVCSGGVCVGVGCTDGVKNGNETDLDCGGPDCGPCADTKLCAASGDCSSSVCSGSPLTCQAPLCTDTVKNGTESDVDCGGATCPKCAPNKACTANGDCVGGSCNGTTCNVTCTDLVLNNGESDADCDEGFVCRCAGDVLGPWTTCVPSSCEDDGDCPGELCQFSQSQGYDCGAEVVNGACTTPACAWPPPA